MEGGFAPFPQLLFLISSKHPMALQSPGYYSAIGNFEKNGVYL